MEKSVHSLLTGEGAEEFLDSLGEKETTPKSEYFDTDIRYKEFLMKSGNGKNNHPQTVGAVSLDKWGKLAAATSTGGLVGKWKGRVGDTAIVGAGIYADEKLAVTCSGDGDAFLRQSVAHKVASCTTSKVTVSDRLVRKLSIMIWRESVQELLLWTIKVRPLLKPTLGSCSLVQWSTAFLELKFWDLCRGFRMWFGRLMNW